MWRYVGEIVISSKINDPSTILFPETWETTVVRITTTSLDASLGLKVTTLARHAAAGHRYWKKRSMISLLWPSLLSTCSISWRRTNQKLSTRSDRIDSPMTGEYLSSQKQTPSIFAVGRHSTITRRIPHSERMPGTFLVSSGSTRMARRRASASRSIFSEYRPTGIVFAI